MNKEDIFTTENCNKTKQKDKINQLQMVVSETRIQLKR